MEIPEDVLEAAEQILVIDNANEVMRESEGSLCFTTGENYENLLGHAETLARWVKKLSECR